MKKALVMLALFAPALYAADLSQQLEQCRSLGNDLQRLVCYDKMNTAAAGAYVKAISNSENTVQTVNVAPVAPAASTKEEFGLERKVEAAKEETEIQNLELVLQSVESNRQGMMVFTFDNGQVWRQTSKDIFTATPGSTYIIERGLLGSFFMNKEGTNRKTRVLREK